MTALVIGYGNPLRGDDGIGWRTAERLEETLVGVAPGIQIVACHQLTPELAEPASRADCVIFIDARADGLPGEIHCETVLPGTFAPGSFSHQFDPPMLLAYADTLYGACPEGILLSVAGESFDYEEGLSKTMQNALPDLVARVQGLIRHE